MADNTTLNTGTGGDVIASDDISSVKYQRIKLVLGTDGVNDGDVYTGNPMPVGGGVAHDAADSGNPIKVGGKSINTFPTATANSDRTHFLTDLWGRQLTAEIDPAQQVWKSANYTSTQTGAIIWAPASGKKIAITSITIGSYGTTSGRLILYLGTAGDTTYTAGTDQLVVAASFAPSTSSKPGLVFCPHVPIFAVTADHNLHITTDAALSVDLTIYGYEF